MGAPLHFTSTTYFKLKFEEHKTPKNKVHLSHMQSLIYALRNDVKQFKQFYLQVQSHLLDTKNHTKMSIILGRIQKEISLIFDEQQSDSGKMQVNTLKFCFTIIKTIL